MGMLVVPLWKRLTKTGDVRHEVAEANADGHGEKYPEREEAIQEGKVLALERSAALALGVRRRRHD